MTPLIVRVFAAHPVVATHYARVLAAEDDVRLTSDDLFDVGVFDGALNNLDGVLHVACKKTPSSRPILVSEHCDEDSCMHWILGGIWGLVAYARYEQELPEAVRYVGDGRLWFPPRSVVRWMHIERRTFATHSTTSLTEREQEVLDLLGRGLSNKEIGTILRITERTAKFHVHNLLAKLQVQSRRDLAMGRFA